MKLTKRMKSAIFQSLIINILFLIVLSGIFFLGIYSDTQSFNEDKARLEDIFESYKEKEKNGLNFATFRSAAQANGLVDNIYIQNVIQNFSPKVYAEYFTNTGSSNYSEHLTQLSQTVNQLQSSEDFTQKQEIISKVLPVYNNDESSDDIMNNFYFINYIERLLYTFNLISDGDIGVKEVKQVILNENNPGDNNSTQEISLESIYTIPMSFSVTGRKQNIAEFIHFFENVGSINLDENGINVYNDNFIDKQLSSNDSNKDKGNIYNNIIATIDEIRFNEYPDSSSSMAGKDIIETMRIQQAREKFSISMDVSFYVSGVPSYQIQMFVQDFHKDFETFYKESNTKITSLVTQKTSYTLSNQIEAINRLKSLSKTLNLFQEEIPKNVIVPGITYNKELFLQYNEYNTKLKRIQQAYNRLLENFQ